MTNEVERMSFIAAMGSEAEAVVGPGAWTVCGERRD